MEENQEQIVEHSKITINGQEYDPADVQSNLDFAKSVRENEQKYGITYDKLWPEYGKRGESLKTYESELSQARQELETFRNKKDAGVETIADEHQAQQARETLRKLGFTAKEDLDKEGYIKKTDLDSWYEQRREAERATEKILSEVDKLEKEIDGTDGRPAFNKRAVLAYMQAYQMPDPKKAYEDMHEAYLKTWQDQQVKAQTKPGLKTLKSTPGNKQPADVKVNKDNFDDILRERLWGSSQ